MSCDTLSSDLIAFAGRLADASRAVIRDACLNPVRGDSKGDGSPVTAIDKAVEDRIRGLIEEAYPDHGIVGEERGASASDRDWVWVLDPIDGTLPFMAGIPVFGTLIALLNNRRPVLGVIDMPATGERWLGVRGAATTCNGQAVRVRRCDGLADALLSTSNPDFYPAADLPALSRLRAATRWTVYGGSCMAYAQIASGRIDVGIDVAFDPFDYLALVPVIEGAGGVISDWEGAPLTLDSGDRLIAACGPEIQRRALDLLNAG